MCWPGLPSTPQLSSLLSWHCTLHVVHSHPFEHICKGSLGHVCCSCPSWLVWSAGSICWKTVEYPSTGRADEAPVQKNTNWLSVARWESVEGCGPCEGWRQHHRLCGRPHRLQVGNNWVQGQAHPRAHCPGMLQSHISCRRNAQMLTQSRVVMAYAKCAAVASILHSHCLTIGLWPPCAELEFPGPVLSQDAASEDHMVMHRAVRGH